jgi:hypothetical protein
MGLVPPGGEGGLELKRSGLLRHDDTVSREGHSRSGDFQNQANFVIPTQSGQAKIRN